MMASAHEEEGLKCALCCDVFQALKRLPCCHLLCEGCLTEIGNMTHVSSKCGVEKVLACPKCYEKAVLPSGSLCQFPTSFYFPAEVCRLHDPEKELFYCSQCHVPICSRCKMAEHEKHETEDLGKVLTEAKADLRRGAKKLSKIKALLEKQRFQGQLNLMCFDGRVQILKRHAMQRAAELIAMVQQCSEQFVAELEKSSKEYRVPLQEYERTAEAKLSTVQSLQQQANEALHGSDNHALVSLTTDMRTGRGGLRKLGQTDAVPHPDKLVLRCDEKALSTETIRSFIGRVVDSHSIPLQQTVRAQELFNCFDDVGMKVHAICIDNHYEQIFVAYGATGAKGKGWVSRCWQKNGTLERESQAITGRVCLGGLNLGWVRVEGEFAAHDWMTGPFAEDDNKGVDRKYDVYNKGDARFALRLHTSGGCDLRAVTIKAGRHTTDNKVCDIDVNTPLAMDVSEDGQLMAVVDQNQDKVLLYRKGHSTPFATYEGNEESFCPHDVCFFGIDGVERLVVADWLNDLLHVVEVGERCTLVGHLGGDCLSMTKPTALFADSKCLWVGCQGGLILTLHQ